MQPNDKIIDRIRKLLALGSNNPNEHEAEVAMRRAHRLLAEYNLSLADMTEAEKDAENPYTRDEQIFRERFRPYGRIIADGIGRLNFCKVFYVRTDRYDQYSFVGRKSNVEVAKLVSEMVCATLCREAKAQSNGRAGFQTNFMAAASRRVFLRCLDMMEKAQEGTTVAEAGTPNLPALRATYLAEIQGAEAFIQNQLQIKIKTTASRATGGRGGADGHFYGDRAGAKVSLRPEVSNKPRRDLPALK